jgi:hypothetical protein
MSKSEMANTHKEYWAFVRETAKEVEKWPGWMKGDSECADKGAESVEAQGRAGQTRVNKVKSPNARGR